MSSTLRARFLPVVALIALSSSAVFPAPPAPSHPVVPLFDGKSLDGWQGAPDLWQARDGAIVGGAPDKTVRQNEFLATTGRYTNFVLRLQFRIQGTNGFINSGVQIRSERVPGNSEMAGYQCDLGDPTWWASLYDESRRNRVLAWSDMASIEAVLKRGDWNDYDVRADGRRISTWINGVLGVDHYEPDPAIAPGGRIGFQIHGGGSPVASFRDIRIEVLPDNPLPVGAPVPPAPPHPSPLSAEEQRPTFSVPPGFAVELVAAEPDGGKYVPLAFDHSGRLWTSTALEYPIDANESPAEAKALFANGGRDRILVIDTPTHAGPQKPRTFAEGVAMPLGVLPYKDGAFAQYGTEVRFYRDADGDGRADRKDAVLTGFGVEDSHLFPHQFTRAPGGWMLLSQGAFNHSNVKGTDGNVTGFNRTKLARFKPGGTRFETIGWGPCNIWGLVLDRHGEMFIQEANDQGWPLMPFVEGGSYPLCGDDVPRPYAPPFPKTGEMEMGGTGLSGLAFSEGNDSFPAPWRDVFFVANPITRKIQAIRLHRGSGSDAPGDQYGNGWQLEHLPDFVLSGDPWFRPVAIAFGPDGCLYIVDWYNAVISHNEVPRNHPDRDKTRGRIWRVRHRSQPVRSDIPDLARIPASELPAHLRAANTWEVNAAWQEIVDRNAVDLAPKLAAWLSDVSLPADLRIRCLWALEGLGRTDPKVLARLFFQSRQRSFRKELLRVLADGDAAPNAVAAVASTALANADRLVRQEGIRSLGKLLDRVAAATDPATRTVRETALRQLVDAGATARAGDWPKAPQYFREFERYLVRSTLERHRDALAALLVRVGDDLAPESRAFAALSLGGIDGARQLAAALPSLGRALATEELLLVAAVPNEPAARATLEAALSIPGSLQLLHDNRARLQGIDGLPPLLENAARRLVASQPSDANVDLLVKVASGFHLAGLGPELVAAAGNGKVTPERQAAALRALRETGTTPIDLLKGLAATGADPVRREAVSALAAAKSDAASAALLELWPSLSPALRRPAADRLAGSPAGARQLVAAIESGAITRDDLDAYLLDKLGAVLPDNPVVTRLRGEIGALFQPVLRLSGADADYVATDLRLDGPFTVECWIRPEPGIGNADSILGGPSFDLNFFDGHFRAYLGAPTHDIVVASKATATDVWTHVAVTRDVAGHFSIHLNGELDRTSKGTDTRVFEHLDVGHSTAAGGTAADFAEFRVWNTCRSADEIRATANVSLPPGAPGLLYHGRGAEWGKLSGGARIERTSDVPPVIGDAEYRELETKFARFRTLAARGGDPGHGRQVFAATCAVCHSLGGQGGKIGPALDGGGAHGLEAVLRNVITPNAAMEAGYRRFRVETKSGDVVEGMLAAQDAASVTVRQPNTEDQKFPRAELKRASFQRGSVMPEGLLEGLSGKDAADLLSFVLTLK